MGTEVIRFAQPEDAEALLEIYRPYVTDTGITFETEVPTVTEFRSRIVQFSERYPYLVLEEDGVPIGYAYAHAFHVRAAYGWSAETSIYVRMDSHRKGYGTRLYTVLLRLMKAQGLYRASALVTMPNEKSLGLHKAMGFEVAGVMPEFGYKNGQWRSVSYLVNRLRPAEGSPDPVIPVSQLSEDTVSKILG